MPRYRIAVNTWESFSNVVEAASEQEALEKARQLWDEDPDSFKTGDSGTDGYFADEMPEVAS